MSRRALVSATILRGLMFSALALLAGPVNAEIIFNGDFSTGNYLQWKKPDEATVGFWGVSSYGRPIQYGGQSSAHVGNGELMSLVSVDGRTANGISYPKGPTRGGSPFASRFMIKSQAGGGIESKDCDPQTSCSNRRSHIDGEDIIGLMKLVPHRSERWMSFSYYIPADFQIGTSGFGPVLTGLKARGSSPLGAFLQLTMEGPGGTWRLYHRWSDAVNPSSWDQVPWWYQMAYDSQSPSASDGVWTDARDFPDVTASRNALASVFKGGWTDWIWHFRLDERGINSGGQGFFKVWKREGSGPWILVLDVRPKVTTRGGRTFDHGIGFNFPDRFSGPGLGLYMGKDRVWHNQKNMEIYLANFKIGSQQAAFSDMAPDGSSPSKSTAPPEPPKVSIN